MNDVVLRIEGVTQRFGGLVAVRDVNVALPRGAIVGLIGPNGAGKTTLFNAVSGFFRPTEGRIVFEGKDVTGMAPHVLALTMLHGWVRIAVLIPTLYLAAFVWENVMLAKPESTRYILLGAMLVGLMVLRPSGLLGERRVEIV